MASPETMPLEAGGAVMADATQRTICPACRPELEWTYEIGCPARHPKNPELRCFREAGHRGIHLANDWHLTIEPTTLLSGRTPTRTGLNAGWDSRRLSAPIEGAAS